MKKSFLKIVACVLVVLALLSANVFATEVEKSSISPRWVSIFDIDLTMAFYDDVGSVTGTASKKADASMIEGTLYVYKYANNRWVYIDQEYMSKTVGSIGLSIDFNAESGVEYKAVFIVTAYTNGVPETETVENYKTCP